MQVASVSTNSPTLRAEIDGWTYEDASLLVKRSHRVSNGKIFIGYTPAPKDIPYYTCILEMLADGWTLLGPPLREESTVDEKPYVQWSWWLTRQRQRRIPA